jgi:Uma2 family endonuclease
MSLEDFDRAEPRDGRLYELSRGIIIVSDVPGKKHFRIVDQIKQQLYLFKATHPEVIRMIGGGSEAKLLVPPYESERHPDISVYKTDPPDSDDIWATWVPEIVVEVISPGSEKRDYEEEPPEYLAFGVTEYWIVDAEKHQFTVMQRSGGRWLPRMLGPADIHKPRPLPGFELQLAPVFEAARDD